MDNCSSPLNGPSKFFKLGGMSFQDLPQDWPSLSLRNAEVADDPFTNVTGVVLAFGHRRPRIRTSDREWARTGRSRLDRLGLALFGCYVAHRRGVEAVTGDGGAGRAEAS